MFICRCTLIWTVEKQTCQCTLVDKPYSADSKYIFDTFVTIFHSFSVDIQLTLIQFICDETVTANNIHLLGSKS